MSAVAVAARTLQSKLGRKDAARVYVLDYAPVSVRAEIISRSKLQLELTFLAEEAETVGEWIAACFDAERAGGDRPVPAFELAAWPFDGGYVWTAKAYAADLAARHAAT